MVHVENIFIHYSTVPECSNLQNVAMSETRFILYSDADHKMTYFLCINQAL